MILTGKVALITGGKRIGLVVAEELARRGVDVGLGYARSRAEADEAAGRVRAAGRRAAIVQADLADPEAWRHLVARVADALGGLDILINMASVYADRPFGELRASDWNAPLSIDLGASFHCAQAAAPLARARGDGRRINFSAWTGPSGR